MKIRHFLPELTDSGELIAFFGDAKLVKTNDCRYELHGGSNEDRIAAKEWVSMFMHEAVLALPARRELRMPQK
jgi:hypothetical protein